MADYSYAYSDHASLIAKFGTAYEIINDGASINTVFAGAPGVAFTTKGLQPTPWLSRGGVGILGKQKESLDLTARYDFEMRDGYDNQTASIKARWDF